MGLLTTLLMIASLIAPPPMVPVISRIPTEERVVFLTIDDGAVRDPRALDLLREHHAEATLFLTGKWVTGHEDYFRDLVAGGSAIANHTRRHTTLVDLDEAGQREEICGNADDFQRIFGTRPTLLRAPGGHYNDTTRRVAAQCGQRALVGWSASLNDGRVDYQGGRHELRPGDIVLMHFRKTFAEDLRAFLDAAKAAGLTPAALGDHLDR
ncbi:polysaccharide deacetylase family protein [Pseudonocardiaceae bacterium YIM PH 21723]|nr:polysaccharide deacetylase family protein [Pseudonocardiaceae bacterium YIM PH 21723]